MDSSIDLGVIAVGAAVFSALTSVFSAVAAIRGLNAATKSTEAQVFLSLSERYLTDKIRDSLRILDEFYLAHRDRFADMGVAWKDLVKRDPSKGDEVKYAARELSLFFVNLGRMYEADLISAALVRALLNTPGVNTFYEVSTPINAAWIVDSVAPHYRKVLQRVVPKFGKGLAHRTLP